MIGWVCWLGPSFVGVAMLFVLGTALAVNRVMRDRDLAARELCDSGRWWFDLSSALLDGLEVCARCQGDYESSKACGACEGRGYTGNKRGGVR